MTDKMAKTIVIPIKNEFFKCSKTYPKHEVITTIDKILYIEEFESGTWLNCNWEADGEWKYKVTLADRRTIEVYKETYDMLKKEMELAV